jgi:GxxExxY protein
LDFAIEDRVVVEVKAVDRLAPIHETQLITYLKLLKVTRGLLLNFNAPRLTKGVRSIVLHERPER